MSPAPVVLVLAAFAAIVCGALVAHHCGVRDGRSAFRVLRPHLLAALGLRIEYLATPEDAGLLVLLAEQYGALLARGWAEGLLDLTPDVDWRVVAARWRGETVGAVLWYVDPADGRAFVRLGCVAPSWRRRGVYAALWAALVARCAAEGVPGVDACTDARNAPALAAARAAGRRVYRTREGYTCLAYEVPC